MPTTCRRQRRYDHRLRDLVQCTDDLSIATELGVPRSTARGWLAGAPRVVVCVEVADLTEPKLRHEILNDGSRSSRRFSPVGPGPVTLPPGAMKNLGRLARSTIADILKQHCVPPSGNRPTSWQTFLRAHWDALVAADFFTTEVWTVHGR